MGLLVATLLAALPAPVTLTGVGGVVPGMTPAQVSARWGTGPLVLQTAPGSTCAVVGIAKGNVRGYAIFEERRFGAVFFKKGVRTDTGIAIGSTLADLRKVYGSRLGILPDKYTPKAKNAFVQGKKWSLRFDVNPQGRVSVIAFGGIAVTYVEACS